MAADHADYALPTPPEIAEDVRLSIPMATVSEMIELADHALVDGMPNAALALIKQTLAAEAARLPRIAPQDTVVAPWTTWLAVVLLECSVCSALIKNDPQSRQNHELHHHRRGDE